MRFYPIHMHLHCSHEQSASIASHMSHAAALGIKHIWTTEHDTRMGKKKKAIPLFYFPEKTLYVTLPNGAQVGFKEEEGNNGYYAFEDTKKGIALLVGARENKKESLYFYSKGKAHSDALFSRLTVEMNADMVSLFAENGRIMVEFILSAQPPSYTQARLSYVLGKMPDEEENVQYLPMPTSQNGTYRFPLYIDASEKIGGVDNALCNIRLVVENGAEILFHTFSFKRELEFEEVRQEQIKLAQQLSKKWGVTPFVGFEITGAGNHKNCYSTTVPVINYDKFDYKVSNEQAIEHVKKYGGIFSWNHPLSGHYKQDKTQEECINALAEMLIAARAYGATLMEVGFPFGRDGFEVGHYMRLWDILAKNGIFITGDGDSDCHDAGADGWTEGNNFCTFAGLDDTDEPTEENFIKAFCRGSVWAGNPVKIKNLRFTCGDKPMGSVVVGKQATVQFETKNVKDGGCAVWVVNGKEKAHMEFCDGKAFGEYTLHCEQKYNFVRVEVYGVDGTLIAFSNPVYLVATQDDVPIEAVKNKRMESK